jgi:pseudaminic acid biosynthesis-associated methylase
MSAEEFWRGEGGKAYTDRNAVGERLTVANNIAFFARALRRAPGLQRVIELGAGAGMNMTALRALLPQAELMAVEVNEYAAHKITEADYIFRSSIQNFQPPVESVPDLAFTKGVLIHIPDADLYAVYEKLFESSRRYILVAEYHSPRREEIMYRGQPGLLWKGPYAEEMMVKYQELELVDYGFVSKLDRWPQDDLHWFLLSKR